MRRGQLILSVRLLIALFLAILSTATMVGCDARETPPGLRQLTSGEKFWDDEPTWLDDDQIVFTRVNAGLMVIKSDGSDLRQVPNTYISDGCPAVSPDGHQIAFTDYDSEEIVVMNADGSERRPVKNADNGARCPRWSLDASKIVFSREKHGQYQLFTVKVDGSDLHSLTGPGISAYVGAWEPNGARIAFTDSNTQELYIIPSEEGAPQRVTFEGRVDPEIAWSSDGKWLVYYWDSAVSEKPPGIYAIHPDGSGRQLLVGYPSAHKFAISPKADMIAFATLISNEGSLRGRIYVVPIGDALR